MKKLLPLLCLAACSSEAPDEAPVEQEPPAPVVVYAAFAENPEATKLFERYKASTGVAIVNRHGDPQAIVDDLIRNDVTPPADVLMTSSVVGAWRAAEESALRPLYSDDLRQKVPAWARDADDLWFATHADVGVIAFRDNVSGENRPVSFAALAEPAYAGKLCLASSSIAINRAVIAMLISELGVRDAELVVRGWVSNLAAPFFAGETELAAAIGAGTCEFGILSRSVAEAEGDVIAFQPEATVATIGAVGVGRHAQNPDGAVRFVEWLLAELPRIDPGVSQPQDVSVAAWNDIEVRKLAERARYF